MAKKDEAGNDVEANMTDADRANAEAQAKAEAMASGATQLTEDEQGEAYTRVAEVDRLRTENMPTQAEVQVAQARPLETNPEDGVQSISADGMSVTTVFPLVAVTACVVGANTYGPGQAFSVGDAETRAALIEKGAAMDRKFKASEDPRPGDPSRTNPTNTNMTI